MSRVSISLLLLAATITAGGIYFYSNGLEGVSSFDSNLAIDIDYYSKASYCKADTLSSWNCGKACSFHSGMTEVQVFNNFITQAQGYCGFDSQKNRIVVAYRGSDNIPNWIADFTFVPVAYSKCNGCMVHQGFLGSLNSISNGVNSCVSRLYKKYPTSKLFVTGHSLGAGIATLSALELAEIVPSSKITFMNFGSPRVGNQAFVNFFVTRIPNATRVVNNRDIVPHVPPQNINGYEFRHINTEVWMTDPNSATQFKVCTQEEDPRCSNSILIPNTSDHTDYFGQYTGC